MFFLKGRVAIAVLCPYALYLHDLQMSILMCFFVHLIKSELLNKEKVEF